MPGMDMFDHNEMQDNAGEAVRAGEGDLRALLESERDEIQKDFDELKDRDDSPSIDGTPAEKEHGLVIITKYGGTTIIGVDDTFDFDAYWAERRVQFEPFSTFTSADGTQRHTVLTEEIIALGHVYAYPWEIR